MAGLRPLRPEPPTTSSIPRVLRVGLLEAWGDRRTFKATATAWRQRANVSFAVLPDRGVWSLHQVPPELAGRRLGAVGATVAEVPALRAEALALAAELGVRTSDT